LAFLVVDGQHHYTRRMRSAEAHRLTDPYSTANFHS
jgi:hypothetical protein